MSKIYYIFLSLLILLIISCEETKEMDYPLYYDGGSIKINYISIEIDSFWGWENDSSYMREIFYNDVNVNLSYSIDDFDLRKDYCIFMNIVDGYYDESDGTYWDVGTSLKPFFEEIGKANYTGDFNVEIGHEAPFDYYFSLAITNPDNSGTTIAYTETYHYE